MLFEVKTTVAIIYESVGLLLTLYLYCDTINNHTFIGRHMGPRGSLAAHDFLFFMSKSFSNHRKTIDKVCFLC